MGEVSEYFDCGAEVDPGDVVFDVGANVGAFALEAAHRCDGALELFCFEPVPPIFGALSANTRRNPRLSGANTSLYEVAVVADEGAPDAELSFFRRLPTDSTCDLESKQRDFELFFARRGEEMRRRLEPALGSVLACRAERVVASIPTASWTRWLMDRAIGHERLRCRTTTLSHVVQEREVPRIDLLKVDVEGAELDVLRGIAECHWSRIRQVVLEGHDHDGRLCEIVELLRARGFEPPTVTRPDGAAERGLNSFLLHARQSAPAR
jgi:FkbM family methyltransferase